MSESLFAVFVVLMFIVSGAKAIPLIARGVSPVVRPLGPPVRVVGRHLRLPLACAIGFGAVALVGFALGAGFGFLSTTKPRTCAWVEGIAAAPVYTCEYGHPYHEQLERIGRS